MNENKYLKRLDNYIHCCYSPTNRSTLHIESTIMRSSEITIYNIPLKRGASKLSLRSIVNTDQTVDTFIRLYDVPDDSIGNLIGFWTSKTHWKNLFPNVTDIDLFAQNLVSFLIKYRLAK